MNTSFYRWPKPATFAGWREKLPDGFLLSIKAPRWMTHYGNLTNADRWMERIKDCWHELGDKRAILLVQLAPRFACNYDRLAHFLDLVPDWMPVAMEFRHPSWHQESIFSLLEQHQAAYCIMACRACCGQRLPLCTSGCTAPTGTHFTAARTPTRNCAGGLTTSATGLPREKTYTFILTMTLAVTPSGMR